MKKKCYFLLISLFFLLVAGCTKTAPVPFPTELIGTWVTKESLYEDRYIEIDETQLSFGTGTDEPINLFIDKIKKKEQKEFVEWTFSCQNFDGDPFDIVLFYKKSGNMEYLEIKNNKRIQWVKLQE